MIRGMARVAVLVLIAALAVQADAAPETGKTILGVGSYWRAYAMWRDAVVPLDLLRERVPGATAPRDLGFPLKTAPPPADWTRPTFDDATWYRSPGPIRPQGPRGVVSDAALMCLRGTFTVTDPARIKGLTLSLTYHGGVVVYLNGVEVARAHLPKGPIGLATPALPYPKDTYLDSRGKTIPSSAGSVHKRVQAGEKDLADRVAARRRRLGPTAVSVSALRKGTNVLAVEVHRSPYQPEAIEWPRSYGVPQGWPHIGVSALRLAADEADAVAPNTSRPKGVQVWNQDVHRVFSVTEYGNPHDALRPIRLVGARNGYYSGQVVVGSTSAITGLKGEVADLTQAAGSGRIAASNVRVRYVQRSTVGISASHSGLAYPGYVGIPAFAALESEPPATVGTKTLKTDLRARAALGLPPGMVPAAVQPVLITVHVPKDASSGRYRGVLTITSAGVADVKVPIELVVLDWTLPAARDFRTFIGLYQSPESVARHYGVPMWSEKHWELMEKSFELLGYLGNRLLLVPLVNRTQLGNDACIVPWIRQRDGSYTHDLTVYERYLALAAKHCALKVVSHHVYLPRGWRAPPPEKPTFVTVVDSETGKREAFKLPPFGTEEAKRLWRPLIAAVRGVLAHGHAGGADLRRKPSPKAAAPASVREPLPGGLAHGHAGVSSVRRQPSRKAASPAPVRQPLPGALKRRGLDERVLVFGIGQDGGVHPDVVAHFKAVFPEARWHYGAHNRPRTRRGRMAYGYAEYMYVPGVIPPPSVRRMHGWKNTPLTAMSQRIYDGGQPPLVVRTMPERALLLGDNGAGRMCLDYWPVKGSSRHGGRVSLFDRWPDSSSDQRCPHLSYLALPGANGAVATIKVEALREGLQEAEARVFVEEALLNGRITGALAERCQALLDRRVNFCRVVHCNAPPIRVTYDGGWQQRSMDLYALAAEVAGVVGG